MICIEKGIKGFLDDGQTFVQSEGIPIWKVTCRINCTSYVMADNEEQILSYYRSIGQEINKLVRMDEEGIYLTEAKSVEEAFKKRPVIE